MANGRLRNVVRQIRKLAARETARPPDRDLLARFVHHHDEAAFAALVQRHAAMVFGVCRRILRHSHDAEDAAQATFLVLARRSGSIAKRGSVGSWLHTVAYRAARRLKADLVRQASRERSLSDVPGTDTTQEATWREVQLVLDEELDRLPEKYRAPLVLCFLEGMTQDEAARQLGWSPGVLRGRVDRGRERLRAQLVRRGVALSAALFGTALADCALAGTIAPAFMDSTVRAAALVAAGQAASPGAISAQVAALAEEVSRTMFTFKLRTAVLALLIVGVLSGVFGFHSLGGQRNDDKPANPNPPSRDDAAKKSKPAEVADAVQVIPRLEDIGETVEPRDTITIRQGLTRLVVLKEKPSSITVSGNDKIAPYTLIDQASRQIAFVGKTPGVAIAYVHFGKEKEGDRQKILCLRLQVLPDSAPKEMIEENPEKRSKTFQKYIQHIVDPSAAVRMPVGQSRLFILKEMPKRIQVVDDDIASFTFLVDKQFILEAKKAGKTIVNLWFGDVMGGAKERVYSTFVVVEPTQDGRTTFEPPNAGTP
jgi:RNA polymerase sigma factor (sigma-70 family)